MRFTVHVRNAKTQTAEVKAKDGTVKNIKKTMNTLTFSGVDEKDEATILSRIVEDKQGIPYKSYFSNDKPVGRSTIKKKK